MPIATLRRETGVATSALRYYETIGLLTPIGRTPTGYRMYGNGAVTRVRFIRKSQAAGLSLDDIATLLASTSDAKTCESVQQVLSQRLSDVRRRLAELRDLERGLVRALADCKDQGEADLCRSICE